MKKNTASDRPISVLLVEEDSSVARLVIAALQIEGYLVTRVVPSVHEARRIAGEEKPDLVLLGHKMIPLARFARSLGRHAG